MAEFDEAMAELEEAVSAAKEKTTRKLRSEALQLCWRVCRSRRMLRQWEGLHAASQNGLDLYSADSVKPGSAAATRILEWVARFQSYRKQAQKDRSVETEEVDHPEMNRMFGCFIEGTADPDCVPLPHKTFENSNVLQYAALTGRVRLLEVMVTHGAAIDVPFLQEKGDFKSKLVAPTDATALLMICANMASAERASAEGSFPRDVLDSIYESAGCAMQLVRLGADPARKNSSDTAVWNHRHRAVFYGKTALELARMTTRKELVELMEQHLSYTPEERAEVAHCRCGSRLPWKACRSTFIGQQPHYRADLRGGLAYRVSPYARCPCRNTSLTNYECCWKNTAWPTYMADSTGRYLRNGLVPLEDTPENREIEATGMDVIFPEMAANDKSELLRRSKEWNRALEAYCDEAGLMGEEWDRVIARHTANPCGPCGRVGCDAFEREVKEFQRCSRCNSIGYCSQTCQTMDCAKHKKSCELK